jgi:hypothetical protein
MVANKIALSIAVIILLIVAFYYLNYTNHIKAPRRISFVLGVCTHGNESSEVYALKHGIRYFRTDISLSKSQEELLSIEHNLYNASYLGILDYETLPGGSSNRNWTLSQWNASIEDALSSYPYIKDWEIWNEPYVPNFQTGYMNGSPYNYFMLIKSAALIIKAREPNATIVCFGGAPLGSYSIMQWYAQVWGYGASKYCNAVSIHAYASPSMFINNINATWNASLSGYEALTDKPIWVTEFGMPSSSALPGYSERLQEHFMEYALSFFNSYNYVKRAYWYDLWGLSDGALKNNFGLLNISDPQSNISGASWRLFLREYSNSSSDTV